MSAIHPTAIIATGAQLHPTVEVGPYSVVGPHVKVGAGSWIGPHVVLDGHTTIGEKNRIFQFASVGAVPQDLKYAGEPTQLVIGDGNTIREGSTLHIGTAGGGGLTRVGHGNLFMAQSHVAHDCQVGNHNIFANGATLAGHVEVEDRVTLGGLAAVHQFTRLGSYSFLAGGAIVVMDVPPYCMVQGDRAELTGLNTVGMTRGGMDEASVARVKDAYRTLFRSKLSLNEAIDRCKAEHGSDANVMRLLTFIQTSKRGVTR